MEQAIRLQNGFYPVALLAGGPEDVYRELREELATRRGIDLRHHWEWKKHSFQGKIPDDVDFVFVLTDMMGHADFDSTKHAVQRACVPMVASTRKRSNYQQRLLRMGFKGVMGKTTHRNVLAELQAKERAAKAIPAETEVPKYVREAPSVPPGALERPQPPPEAPPDALWPSVSLYVRQAQGPIEFPPARPRGIARPETLTLVAALQAMALEDGVSILISGKDLTVGPLAPAGGLQ